MQPGRMGFWSWLTGGRRKQGREPLSEPVRAPVRIEVRRERAARPRPRHSPPTTVLRREYMPREQEELSFVLGSDGLPTGRLRRERDRLVIFTDDGAGMVNPSSARLHTLGLYCFRIRGVSYHEAAVRAGDFRPGRRVRLVREPDNEHDPNAVAVYASRARRPAGYVNKMNAKRLARRLDTGDDLMAISVRGTGPGIDGPAPWVLVGSPSVLDHLQRSSG